jgi:hypothetical protein
MSERGPFSIPLKMLEDAMLNQWIFDHKIPINA